MKEIYTKNLYLSNKWKECNIRQLGMIVLFALGMLFSPAVFAQKTSKIKGVVKDDKGVPMPGVGVKVKGTAIGTSTNIDGIYNIAVPGDAAILVFSYIGFLPQEVPVGKKTDINVSLKENLSDLEEVVVTGYGGVAKKKDLTGASSSINQKTILERQPVNLFDALQGQAAGVLIVNDGGGAPGATGSIQIRGASTLNGGNGPLYIVDGVINPDGANINPTDIANVEVLKDAASASIYGSRAANGVILITTKRGQDGKPMIDLTYNHVFGRLAHGIPVSNSAEVRAFREIQARPNGTDSLNPSFNADNNLQELLLGNLAQKKEIKMGISGGQKGLSYYTSINYLDDKSIIINSWAKRLQSRINVNYQVNEKLKYSNNMSFSWQKGNQIPVGNTIKVVIDRPAYSLIYYPDGTLTSYVASKRNPIAQALFERDEDETFSGQFNNQLDYQFTKDLKFTTLFNAKLDNFQNLYFSPRILSGKRDQNSGKNELRKNFSWEYQAFMNYNKTIREDHNFSALLGFSADRKKMDRVHTEYLNSVSEEIVVTLPDYVNGPNTFSEATANSTVSMFSRLGYNYKGRYIVQGTYRRDGSSRFGPENRWGNFLSASAAWRFSDEKFMSWSKSFLEDAKIRYSYGQLGNDQIGDYESVTRIAFSGSYNGLGSAAPTSILGNKFIKWETTAQNNVGLDLSFFKGRLGFTGDYYVKKTSNLLYPREIAKETGYSKVQVNVGTIQTKGLEFVINGTPIATKDFEWNITANISFEKGKVLSLADGVPFFAGNKWYVEEGGRIGNFYGWKNLGVYAWDESNAYDGDWRKLEVVLENGKPKYANGKAVYTLDGQEYTGNVKSKRAPDGKLKGGDAEWEEVRPDGVIDDADRQILGNATPDYYLGIMNNVRYKNFSLSFLFNGSFGAEVYNSLLQTQNNPSNTGAGSPEMVYNSWRKPGDNTKYPYYVERNNRGNLKTNQNSLYIENASFIRLSSARLSYRLNPDWAKRIFLKGLTTYVYGTNLLTWTNYRGYDPEFSAGNVLTPGDDTGKYPRRREFGFGVNINL
ncbi:SusC/RagA family TonB-linked outer membrane protein [Pedobacter caeni]|uniref:TonB-linked outer membrane protein, SusC/RagA family n=1 Tax=Pedobacter caeni TaxID=288992 RepID=A0A1M5IST5_9SPHI|nr:TonB-dependent receptor [Pedobacter caeni]SHG31384.1 TonB-linked outer membrane protein, SusC/RagA family [Pedobacter caeni]